MIVRQDSLRILVGSNRHGEDAGTTKLSVPSPLAPPHHSRDDQPALIKTVGSVDDEAPHAASLSGKRESTAKKTKRCRQAHVEEDTRTFWESMVDEAAWDLPDGARLQVKATFIERCSRSLFGIR